jgi:hypothetical protein
MLRMSERMDGDQLAQDRLPDSPPIRSDENRSQEEKEETSRDVEDDLMAFTMKQLFVRDPIEYVNDLVVRADQEWHDLRRRSFTGALQVTSLNQRDVSPPPPTPTGGSRFASFVSSTTPSPLLFPGRPPLLLSSAISSHVDSVSAIISTATGSFTSGAQLAILLVLEATCTVN